MARILLAEDNDPVRWSLASLLKFAGHDVDQAADGQQALACFAAQPSDVVLLDVNMPRVDGLEACRRLRQQSQVPILMLSTISNPDLQQEVLGCGANAFLRKPLEFEQLLTWVRQVCEGTCWTLNHAPRQLAC